jgi:hypothetical protein
MNQIKEHLRKCEPVWGRVMIAVESLASASGPIQERLASVYLHQLMELRTFEFPEYVRQEFIGIIDDLAVRHIPSDGPYSRVEVTDDEGRDLARRIVDLYMHIDSVQVLSDRLTPTGLNEEVRVKDRPLKCNQPCRGRARRRVIDRTDL